jgi:hypothetical protein
MGIFRHSSTWKVLAGFGTGSFLTKGVFESELCTRIRFSILCSINGRVG